MKTPYRVPGDLPSDHPPPAVGDRDDDLGALVSVHSQRVSLLPIVTMFALMTIAAFGGLMQRRGIATVVVVAFAGICLLTLIGMTFRRLRPQIELWDRGLRVRRRWTMPRRVRFDEIDAITYEPDALALPALGMSLTITITTFEDRRIVIPRHLGNMEAIVAALDRHVTRPLLAPAMRAFANRETLHFGPIVLGDGIIVLDELILSLESVDCVEATDREIRIYDKKTNWPPFAKVPLHTVKHPRVLLAVLATRVPVEDTTGLAV
jgi:hypothetical protein